MAGPDLVVRVAANISALQDDMKRAALSVKTMEESLKDAGVAGKYLVSSFEELGHLLSGTLAAGALIEFAHSVFEAAENIESMALKTNMSVEELQRLNYIASQTNTSIETMVSATQNLEQRLGNDDSGAAGAMKKLGINTDEFRKLGAYEQMTTLSEAIRSIEDPLERAAVEFGLFGRAWKEVAPAMLSDMKEIGNQAPIMADETVKSLAEAEKAWKGLWVAVKTYSGEALIASDTLTTWTNTVNPVILLIKTLQTAAEEGAKTFGDETGLAGAMAKIPPIADQTKDSIVNLTLKGQDLKDVENDLTIQHMKHVAALREQNEAADAAAKYAEHLLKVDEQLNAEYERAAARAEEDYARYEQMTLESDRYTRDHYQLIMDRAREAYDFALDHLSSYTQAEIQMLAEASRKATESYNNWTANATADLEKVRGGTDAATDSTQQLVAAVEGLQQAYIDVDNAKNRGLGTTTQVTSVNFLDMIDKFNHMYDNLKATGQYLGTIPQIDPNVALSLAQQDYSYSDIIAYLTGSIHFLGPPSGHGIPGFAGGVSDFAGGLAVVGEHGPELVSLPPHSSVTPAASIVNHIYVTQPLGSPQAIAAAVNAAQMDSLRAQGLRLPSGA